MNITEILNGAPAPLADAMAWLQDELEADILSVTLEPQL